MIRRTTTTLQIGPIRLVREVFEAPEDDRSSRLPAARGPGLAKCQPKVIDTEGVAL